MATDLAAVLEAQIAAIPRRPLPPPYAREAAEADAAHARCQFAARTLAEAVAGAFKVGSIVCSGEVIGEALDGYLAARAEEKAAAEVIRSPRTGTGKSNLNERGTDL